MIVGFFCMFLDVVQLQHVSFLGSEHILSLLALLECFCPCSVERVGCVQKLALVLFPASFCVSHL